MIFMKLYEAQEKVSMTASGREFDRNQEVFAAKRELKFFSFKVSPSNWGTSPSALSRRFDKADMHRCPRSLRH